MIKRDLGRELECRVSLMFTWVLAVDQAIAGRAGAPVVLLLRAVPKSAGAKLQRKLQWTQTFWTRASAVCVKRLNQGVREEERCNM